MARTQLARLAVWLPLVLLCVWTVARLSQNLGHPALFGFDEAAHQLATRGLRDTGLPTIHAEPLVEEPPSAWWEARVFLHKPPLPFALGALLMLFLGATPLALRLVSLGSALAAAAGLFLLGRRLLGPRLGACLALAFLCLPFGYLLIQGYQFGDVTDCSLLAFVTLSMCLLVAAVERDSAPLASVAGALCGCGYLCKSALALVPLGAAGSVALLGAVGLSQRVRPRLVLAFAATAVAVALPWNVYSALRWPEVYRWEAHHTLGFLSDPTRYWSRPIDGVFNEVNQLELDPWPVALFPLAGLWLLWAAASRRSALSWLICLWLWGEWLPLSLATVKVPAHAWAAAPAALLAVGLTLRDSLERPWLAGACLGALGTGLVLRFAPVIERVRGLVPATLAETATHPGLAEGLALALLGGLVGLAATRPLSRRGWSLRPLGWAALSAAGLVGLVQASFAMQLDRLRFRGLAVEDCGDVLGRALAGVLPEDALLFVSARDPQYRLGTHHLMFYGGRMAYPADEELLRYARLVGLHPYLASGLAQPFERVAASPGASWLQAFDLDAPRVAPAELPADVTRVDRQLGALTLLGVAVTPGDLDRDRYVFYVRSAKDMERRQLDLAFTLDDGSVERTQLAAKRELDWPLPPALGEPAAAARVEPPATSLADPPIDWINDPRLAAWYALSTPGPPRARLRRLVLLGAELPLP